MEHKRITLHPLKDDGTLDLNTNLYPKTLLDGIVDRDGEQVNVALEEDIVHKGSAQGSQYDETIYGSKTFASPISQVGHTGYYMTMTDKGFSHWSPALKVQNLIFEEPNAEHTLTIPAKDGIIAVDEDVVHKIGDETIYGEKSFGGIVKFGAYNAGAGGFLSEGSISNFSLVSLDIEAVHNLNLIANGYPGIATSGFSFKDYYKPNGSSTLYTSSYRFPDKTAENKSYTIATTDNIPDDSNLVHKGTSSSPSNEDIYGLKTFKSGGISFSSTGSNDVINITGSGSNAEVRICPANTSFPTYLRLGSTSNSYGQLTLSTFESISQSHPSSDHAIIGFTKGSGSTAKHAYLIIPNVGTSSDPKTIATTEDCTKLYRHRFDINLDYTDLPLIPEGAAVAINVNALSTSGTKWETLSELDGGGFIVSAFGNIPNNYDYIFELKLFYSALGNGTLLLNIHDLTDNTVKAVTAATVGGGQAPNTFALQDSTTPL